MKLYNKISIAIVASLLTGSVLASTAIDIRHEWKTYNGDESTRIKLGHNYKINKKWEGNTSIEMKFRSNDRSDTYKNNATYETELDNGLTYKLNQNWEFKPGMPIAMTSERTTYKPQVRVVYKTTDMMGIWTALRYRYEFINYSDSDGKKGDTDKNGTLHTSSTKSKSPQRVALKFQVCLN